MGLLMCRTSIMPPAAFAGLCAVPLPLVVPLKAPYRLSLYGAFSGTTNGNGTAQSPANAAGGMIEVRHISNPIVGYEATYSFNRANQTYSPSGYACPVTSVPSCPP